MAKGATPSSSSFHIAETDTFRRQLKKRRELEAIYRKIKSFVYPMLRENPFFGPNIKRLKGEFSDIYRYRIGDYRLFYTVEQSKVTVFILRLDHRKEAYRRRS